MGYTGSGGSNMGSRESVIGQVHMPSEGNNGAVGGPTPISRGMLAGDQL